MRRIKRLRASTQGIARVYYTQTQTRRQMAHPQMQAPIHAQSRLPRMTLGFTHMSHDIHVGKQQRYMQTHTKNPTHIQPKGSSK